VVRKTAQVSPGVYAKVEANQKVTEGKVSVDRKSLLMLLVQAENALAEVRQLKKEIKGR